MNVNNWIGHFGGSDKQDRAGDTLAHFIVGADTDLNEDVSDVETEPQDITGFLPGVREEDLFELTTEDIDDDPTPQVDVTAFCLVPSESSEMEEPDHTDYYNEFVRGLVRLRPLDSGVGDYHLSGLNTIKVVTHGRYPPRGFTEGMERLLSHIRVISPDGWDPDVRSVVVGQSDGKTILIITTDSQPEAGFELDFSDLAPFMSAYQPTLRSLWASGGELVAK